MSSNLIANSALETGLAFNKTDYCTVRIFFRAICGKVKKKKQAKKIITYLPVWIGTYGKKLYPWVHTDLTSGKGNTCIYHV